MKKLLFLIIVTTFPAMAFSGDVFTMSGRSGLGTFDITDACSAGPYERSTLELNAKNNAERYAGYKCQSIGFIRISVWKFYSKCIPAGGFVPEESFVVTASAQFKCK